MRAAGPAFTLIYKISFRYKKSAEGNRTISKWFLEVKLQLCRKGTRSYVMGSAEGRQKIV